MPHLDRLLNLQRSGFAGCSWKSHMHFPRLLMKYIVVAWHLQDDAQSHRGS
jgi:hypothetical protein